MIKVIVIAGATGVGKTELSIKLAKMFNGEIVMYDVKMFVKTYKQHKKYKQNI